MPPSFGVATALALLAGGVACLWLPWLMPWPLSAALLPVAATLWWMPERVDAALSRMCGPSGSALGTRVTPVVGAALFGIALAGLHAAYSLSLQLPASPERHDVVVSGRIVDLPQHEPRRTRFLFRVDTESSQASLRGRSLRLAWYDDDPARRAALKAGQRWRFPVRLRAPRGLRNPGGFDSEKYALAQRITATGYVHDPSRAQRLSNASGLEAWRETMSARIATTVPAESSRYIRALALGDTRALTDDDWAALRANGLTHLIAISGFHVGLVAGFFALFARAAWWLWPALGKRCPAPIAAAVAALLGASLYAAVAGFALPTVRTVLMIAVVAGARAWRRPLRAADALALAAIAVLLVDPLAVLGAGFWLSFLGVAWLLWCLPHGGHKSGPGIAMREFLSAQGVATLGLLPLSVVLFGQASLAGPFANLVAVPWWSLVVVPLSLIGLVLESVIDGAGAWVWRAAAWCFDLTWPLFEWLAGSGLALWWLPESRWFALPMALLGAFWLLLPRGVPGKALALLLWLPLLWPDRQLPAHGEAELTVIDVGQGLSVLVRTRDRTLLYDMGPAVRDGFDAGERAVVPALHALGVRRLDRAVISHGDNDHAGGLESVRREFPVGLYAPPDVGLPLVTVPCAAGQGWTWNGVRFRFLHPPRHFPYLKNESSCVLRVETLHGSVLLTGDVGEVIERDLVHRYPRDLRSDVVLVAHHGSGGSSDPAFVSAVRPKFALVSSGHGNRFRHPKPEVVARWQRSGAETFDTSDSGAIRIGLRARGIQLETRRRAQPRLWDASRRTPEAAIDP
ncbi:MAG TPA: DNA internalization-related competence protein ComEC/Rec2 [Lysobacter sp.]